MTETKVEQAVRLFAEGMLCSQAMLLAYGPQFGIDEETAIRVARPFGSGVARMCGTCGAVSGAYMVLGLRSQGEDEKAAKEETYELCREFAKRFAADNGSTNCYELLQCDLGSPEGQSRFREQQLVAKCRAYVKSSAEILESILHEKA